MDRAQWAGRGTRLMVAVTAPVTAAVFLRGQLGWLRASGYDVMLVSAPGPQLDALARQEGVCTTPLPVAREIHLWADLVALARFIGLLLRQRPEITHVSTPKVGLLGGLAAWLTRVPNRVYTLRGLRLETAHGFRRVVLWVTEMVACRTAHIVVAVSPSLARRARELRLARPRNIIVIGHGSSNGVQAECFSATPERRHAAGTLRSRLGIASDAPVVGFVGRLTPDKGLTELLAAFHTVRATLPAARLLIIGDGDNNNRALVAPPELDTSAVLRTGWLDDPSVAYHAMDVLALPTYREGFPNVPLEAAASGRPVVTTTATGAVDSVLDGETGILVPPREVGALASALLQLLLNPTMAARMGAAGEVWVRRYFCPTAVWEGVADVYADLLARRAQLGRPTP